MKSNIGFFPLRVTEQHDGVSVTYQNGGPTRGLGGGSEASDLALRSSEQDGSQQKSLLSLFPPLCARLLFHRETQCGQRQPRSSQLARLAHSKHSGQRNVYRGHTAASVRSNTNVN